MPITLRSRLLLLVLSVLLPAVVASGWLIERNHDAEREALAQQLRDTTRALALIVERELVQRAAVARVLAVSQALEQPALLSPAQLGAFAEQARRAVQGFDGWVELRSAEAHLVSTRAQQPPPALLQQRAAAAPLAEALTVGALEGDADGGGLYATIVQPVQREGRTVANVVITILPAELQTLVDKQPLPTGWIGSVVDRSGTLIARHPDGGAFTGRAAAEDLRRQLASQREGRFESVSADGERLVGYFSTGAQGWTTITALPQQQLPGALPVAAAQLTAGALVLLAAAVASALWLARRIERPVLELQDAARRLQAGQQVAPAATGITELDAVAGALAEAGQAVQQHQADLERRVADAVAAARSAEQHAARSQRSEALVRLTGGVAHDFNNLLGVISNSAHLMQRHAAADELRTPLSAVLRSVEAGSRLTQHLVRIAGRHPARPATLDLRQFLPEAQELLKLVLGKRIALDVVVKPDTRKLNLDAGELELALINLALNSRDALKAGGRVWISAQDASADDSAGLASGDYVLISFSDDGAGIADQIVDRVFEPFFTTKGVGQGTGLGLAQVQGFCAQAGGRARLASTPGVGTSVLLLLPAAGGMPATPGAVPAGGATTAPPVDQRLQGRRVLLVEDNDELASVTSALLVSYGCAVQTARSPKQALALIEQQQQQQQADGALPFDIVLSDVVMPGDMDGLALAHALRARYPALPVVLISGYSSALHAAPDFPVLQKPCTPEQLTAALADAMSAAPAAAPGAG